MKKIVLKDREDRKKVIQIYIEKVENEENAILFIDMPEKDPTVRKFQNDVGLYSANILQFLLEDRLSVDTIIDLIEEEFNFNEIKKIYGKNYGLEWIVVKIRNFLSDFLYQFKNEYSNKDLHYEEIYEHFFDESNKYFYNLKDTYLSGTTDNKRQKEVVLRLLFDCFLFIYENRSSNKIEFDKIIKPKVIYFLSNNNLQKKLVIRYLKNETKKRGLNLLLALKDKIVSEEGETVFLEKHESFCLELKGFSYESIFTAKLHRDDHCYRNALSEYKKVYSLYFIDSGQKKRAILSEKQEDSLKAIKLSSFDQHYDNRPYLIEFYNLRDYEEFVKNMKDREKRKRITERMFKIFDFLK